MHATRSIDEFLDNHFPLASLQSQCIVPVDNPVPHHHQRVRAQNWSRKQTLPVSRVQQRFGHHAIHLKLVCALSRVRLRGR
ncbi:Uncharacterised protein [Vibrio cholerae]|uniref:Uncharacterized protein n=1 Tax=Vibrio cholerae TaxID=666 RepID=A0A655PL43_VIBCL|nr:Uncharacterised protein [Vibrio cholerae]CSC02794.1 Uncharacterised protein [Vibrio cholerae]